MPHDLWKRVQAVNLDGAFYVVQGMQSFCHKHSRIRVDVGVAVANQMKEQTPQGGSIIAISSISALVGGGMVCIQ